MASWSWGLPLENSLNAGRKFHAKSFQPIPKGCPSRCMASPMVHLQVQAVDICKFCRQSLKEWLGVSPHVHMGHSQSEVDPEERGDKEKARKQESSHGTTIFKLRVLRLSI